MEKILGILMLNTRFPRIPGDVGNPASYDFPIRLKIVEQATVNRVVNNTDPELLPVFIQAAQELEDEGVGAITTSCGFLVLFQNEIAQSLKIPVFTSSLLQVPLVYRLTQARIGIITANAKTLTPIHLKAAGIENIPIAVAGLEDQEAFSQAILQNGKQLDKDRIQAEVVNTAREVLLRYPDIGAFVFECHNLPPYSKAVQEVTNRPVFDILTLATTVYQAINR